MISLFAVLRLFKPKPLRVAFILGVTLWCIGMAILGAGAKLEIGQSSFASLRSFGYATLGSALLIEWLNNESVLEKFCWGMLVGGGRGSPSSSYGDPLSGARPIGPG